MIRLQWIILCRDAIIDQKTNNMSLITIIDEVRTSEIPARIVNMKMVVFFVIDGKAENGLMKIEFIGPEGTEHSMEGPIEFSTKNNRAIVDLDQIVFKAYGEYKFQISLRKTEKSKWVKKGEIVLPIQSISQDKIIKEPKNTKEKNEKSAPKKKSKATKKL